MGRLSSGYWALLVGATSAVRFDIVPDNTGIDSLGESQLASEQSNSYWAASFVTASNDRQYAIMSQQMPTGAGQSIFQSSILDLEDTSNYWLTAGLAPLQGNLTIKNGLLDIEVEGSAFKSASSDSFSSLNTWGKYDTYAFNLTFDASSPVMLNGGGSFTINGTTLEVDPTKSLTWYDRQHGAGGPNNFTWFGLNFPSGIRASIWYSDTAEPSQQLRFATIRAEDGLHIVRFKMVPGNATTWTSPVTNTTYAQDWKLFFDNGDSLSIKSIRQDQEKGSGAGRFYSGVVEAEGSLFGQEKGFGFVDIVPKLSL
ncbi:uncharacterized protein CLUP02_10015 [Colletotrichum lupini]|uniref:Kievitone hydratase n=1 Tax=Colletotrichum lupini TaxID=145971 RepID=A0A9Q8WI51_9PEZI|nr:uncharacterized protein CLUP02_10015 [Colletotrichum lupini]UQC84518.1 hypothetical protein CLUP02_10015 [Colletotrichum lupini]